MHRIAPDESAGFNRLEASMNQQLNDDIETVFLMAAVSLQPIASKLVKEIARYGGSIDKFVTPAVAADVRRHLSGSR